MGALLLGAVFAKVISTASNYLFSPATNLVEDVFVRYIAPGRLQQARPHRLAACRGAARLLGALPGHLRAQHSGKDALRLHHLLRRAHAGGAGRVLFQARDGLGRGGRHRAGTVVTLAWDAPGVKSLFPPILAERDAIFPALFAAVAAMIVVSLFTPKPTAEQLAKLAE